MDKSGIYSLGGFSFQIHVFALNMLKIRYKGENIGFESIDDVSLHLSPETIDDAEGLCGLGNISNSIRAIQVKKTRVTKDIAKRVLKNWISISVSVAGISKYELVTNQSMDVHLFDSISASEIFDDVYAADPSGKSIDSKLARLAYSIEEFEKVISTIKDNIIVSVEPDINSEIYENYKEFFNFEAVAEITYRTRLVQFLQEITCELLSAIDKKEAFNVDYRRLLILKEKYIRDISDEIYIPSYSNFKRLNRVDLSQLATSMSREYEQLKECIGLKDNDIRDNLLLGGFYSEYKRHFYDLGKKGATDDIEETAYGNFCDTKIQLISIGNDTPTNRLMETKQKANSHAQSDQIRQGVCISLTGKNTPNDLLISWKD